MRGRVVSRLKWASAQLGHSRRVVRDVGWKMAVGERAGAMTAKSPLWRDRDAQIAALVDDAEQSRQRIDELTAALASRSAEQAAHDSDRQASIDATNQRIDASLADLQTAIDHGLAHDLPGRIASLRDELMPTLVQRDDHIRWLQQQADQLRDRLTGLNHVVADWLWAANAPLAGRPTISIVMTTAFPQRIGYLRSAIESVVAQTYTTWDLTVIDDAAEPFLDPLPDWWPNDTRVRMVRGAGLSEGRARNIGVDNATGDVIAYLDDDCRWFPWWLHAVARAFSTDPDLGLVHGVRVVEGDPGGDPWTYAQVLDPLSLHTGNPVDTNVLAHRRNLPDGEWPDLSSCADFDTVIRLSGSGARFLPVPAVTYAVSSPSRAWAPERAAINAENFRTVQRRARRARPLRVVAHNGLYPLLSETYIGDELAALQRRDIDIVLSRVEPASVDSPSRIDAPLYESLESAISAHDPDIVLTHWAGIGLAAREICAAAQVPYGIRLHSFDGDLWPSALVDHWCAGIWTFPHFPRDHHLVANLDTLILDPPTFTDGARDRRVLSLSAGLPKKDFGEFVAAMAAIRDSASGAVPFDVVMATTNGFETLPAEVRSMIKHHDLTGGVIENIPFEHAQRSVRTAGALVYLLRPDHPIGQPRSILEAAIAGTPLVVPDDDSVTDLIGTTAHRYRRGDRESLVRAIGDALERPHPVDEREALSARVVARHSGRAAIDAWADSLTGAVVGWQRTTRIDREGKNLRWWWPN